MALLFTVIYCSFNASKYYIVGASTSIFWKKKKDCTIFFKVNKQHKNCKNDWGMELDCNTGRHLKATQRYRSYASAIIHRRHATLVSVNNLPTKLGGPYPICVMHLVYAIKLSRIYQIRYWFWLGWDEEKKGRFFTEYRKHRDCKISLNRLK